MLCTLLTASRKALSHYSRISFLLRPHGEVLGCTADSLDTPSYSITQERGFARLRKKPVSNFRASENREEGSYENDYATELDEKTLREITGDGEEMAVEDDDYDDDYDELDALGPISKRDEKITKQQGGEIESSVVPNYGTGIEGNNVDGLRDSRGVGKVGENFATYRDAWNRFQMELQNGNVKERGIEPMLRVFDTDYLEIVYGKKRGKEREIVEKDGNGQVGENVVVNGTKRKFLCRRMASIRGTLPKLLNEASPEHFLETIDMVNIDDVPEELHRFVPEVEKLLRSRQVTNKEWTDRLWEFLKENPTEGLRRVKTLRSHLPERMGIKSMLRVIPDLLYDDNLQHLEFGLKYVGLVDETQQNYRMALKMDMAPQSEVLDIWRVGKRLYESFKTLEKDGWTLDTFFSTFEKACKKVYGFRGLIKDMYSHQVVQVLRAPDKVGRRVNLFKDVHGGYQPSPHFIRYFSYLVTMSDVRFQGFVELYPVTAPIRHLANGLNVHQFNALFEAFKALESAHGTTWDQFVNGVKEYVVVDADVSSGLLKFFTQSKLTGQRKVLRRAVVNEIAFHMYGTRPEKPAKLPGVFPD